MLYMIKINNINIINYNRFNWRLRKWKWSEGHANLVALIEGRWREGKVVEWVDGGNSRGVVVWMSLKGWEMWMTLKGGRCGLMYEWMRWDGEG